MTASLSDEPAKSGSPLLWLSRWVIVISRPRGTNPGNQSSTVSVSDRVPSSTSCKTTVAIIGLVTLPMRNRCRGVIATWFSRSAIPANKTDVSEPRRTKTTPPGMAPVSTASLRMSCIRASRGDRPTVGRVIATLGEVTADAGPECEL